MSAPPTGAARTWSPTARTTTLLTVTGILVVGQMYVALPLFTPMSESFSAPVGGMTWMATGFGLAYAAGFLFAGPLSDRYGPRQVIVVGLLATTATTMAVALAPTLPAGIALRALQGFTAASFAPAAFSYVTSQIAPERRTFALTCVTSGFLAAAVVMQVGSQALEALAGWRIVFVVCGPLLAVLGVLSRRVLEPGQVTRTVSARSAFAAMPKLLANPRLLALYGTTSTLLGGFVAIYTAVSLTGPPGVAGNASALLWLRASALPAVIAVPMLTTVISALPARIRLPGALGLAGLATLVASISGDSVVALGAALLVLAAGIGIGAPALVEAIGAEGATARGSAVALYACAMFIGASIGPQLANALSDWGFGGTARVVAAIFAVGAVLGIAAAQSTRGHRKEQQCPSSLSTGTAVSASRNAGT